MHPEFSPLYITPPNFVRVLRQETSHVTAQMVSQGTLSLSMYLDVRPIIQIRGKRRATVRSMRRYILQNHAHPGKILLGTNLQKHGDSKMWGNRESNNVAKETTAFNPFLGQKHLFPYSTKICKSAKTMV